MNALLVILNTILLALGVVIIGVSSAAIDKLNRNDDKKDNPNLIAYWYTTLGVAIAMILVIIFMIMGNSVMFMNRDTYLE